MNDTPTTTTDSLKDKILDRRSLGLLGLAAVASGTSLAVAGPAPDADAAGKYKLGSATLHGGSKSSRSRGTYVKNLQRALNAEHKAGLKVDGSFGPGTEKALRSYQKSRGLKVDGRCGPATKKALNASKKGSSGGGGGGKYSLGSGTIHSGQKGKQVKNLQKALNKENKAGLKVDGSFGPAVLAAVKSYQKSRGLSVDGRCGPATKKALNASKKGSSSGGGGKGWTMPLHGSYRVSSEFDPKRKNPVTGKITPHEGIDLACAEGRRIYAARAGKVVHAGYDKSEGGKSGNQVTIDHGDGYKTKYSHLSSWDVKVGQKVKADQKIANAGSTGRATGPHLHFGVMKKGKFINPRKIMKF